MVASSSLTLSSSSSTTAATAAPAANATTDLSIPLCRGGDHRRRDILMTEQELNAVLNQPFFPLPMTFSSVS